MEYDPGIHHRRSIRLRGYDYSQLGFYFVTICTHEKRHLFGEVVEWEMVLNSAGKMAEAWWNKLPGKFPGVEVDAFVVMPNHVHGILRIVGADPSVRPQGPIEPDAPAGARIQGARKGAPLPRIVQWFKTMTTNEYLRNIHATIGVPNTTVAPPTLWQRNYYEHIVRNDGELAVIRNYLRENPARWDTDPENA